MTTNNLRLELIANGQQSGTWGDTTNKNLGTLLDAAISNVAQVTISALQPWFNTQATTVDDARNAVIQVNTSTGADFTAYITNTPKLYVIKNVSNYKMTLANATGPNSSTSAGGATVVIPIGKTALVYTDGTNCYQQFDYVPGNLSVGGNFALTTSSAVTLYSTNIESLSVTGAASFGTTQTVTYSTITLTAAASPQVNATVAFTTNGTLPTGLTAGALYYVLSTGRTATQFQISATSGGSAISLAGGAGSTLSMYTVPVAPTAATGANSVQIATTAFVNSSIANSGTSYQTLKAVQVATTASISPFPPTSLVAIDGYTVAAGDRVLVKDQGMTTIANAAAAGGDGRVAFTFASQSSAVPVGTIITVAGITPTSLNGTYTVFSSGLTYIVCVSTVTGISTVSGTITYTMPNANNGVYTVAASGTAWARSTDADTATKIAAAQVPVLQGPTNGGKTFTTTFKSTDTLTTSGTTMLWYELATTNSVQTLANKTINAIQLVDGTITPSKLNGGQSGNAPIYGVRAWASFNPNSYTAVAAAYTWAGTLCTVSSANHGFLTGDTVYLNFTSGAGPSTVAANKIFYTVTKIDDNSFSVTSTNSYGAVTPITGAVSYYLCTSSTTGNVRRICVGTPGAAFGVAQAYSIMFTQPMADDNYAWSGNLGQSTFTQSGFLSSPSNINRSVWITSTALYVGAYYANNLYVNNTPEYLSIIIVR